MGALDRRCLMRVFWLQGQNPSPILTFDLRLPWPFYTNGTIGAAKQDVERAAQAISEKYDCGAYVAVNKAVVTQASSAIPVVPSTSQSFSRS